MGSCTVRNVPKTGDKCAIFCFFIFWEDLRFLMCPALWIYSEHIQTMTTNVIANYYYNNKNNIVKE